MADIPNLAGIATENLVEKIAGAGSFKASYINWARTINLLHTHAPGWMPELVAGPNGVVHDAPVGAFLLIRFRHLDGTVTPEVPQAIMDNRNAAIPLAKVTARDITDTHRRGVCMAAAFTFGLAYELWAKMPLEAGFSEDAQEPAATITEAQALTLYDWIATTDSDTKKFCAVFGVDSVESIPAAQFNTAVAKLKAKAEKLAA